MSEIDLIVTYLDSSDQNWKDQYKYWEQNELDHNINFKSNRQAFGEERFRNWGDAFKYWFRGVDKNMPWIRYIHLICFDENHVPKWLDKNNPKLRIHYHKDFIPEEYLPTFSALTIEMFLYNIEDLSEVFIMSNDDFYILNKVNEDLFIKNNKPQAGYRLKKRDLFLNTHRDMWDNILNNSIKFYDRNISKTDLMYDYEHIFYINLKSIGKELLNYSDLIKANTLSRFRSNSSIYTGWLVYVRAINKKLLEYNSNTYKQYGYAQIKSKTNFNGYSAKNIVCFNDTECCDNYEVTKNNMLNFLDKMLPNKCSFEV